MLFLSLLSISGALCGTALGAYITHNLAKSRYLHDKIWDQKQVAYSLIVSHFFRLLSIATKISRGYKQDAVAWHSSPKREAANNEMTDIVETVADLVSKNILILSDNFVKDVQTMIKLYSSSQNEDDELQVEWIELLREGLSIGSTKIVMLGRRELMNDAWK